MTDIKPQMVRYILVCFLSSLDIKFGLNMPCLTVGSKVWVSSFLLQCSEDWYARKSGNPLVRACVNVCFFIFAHR